MSRLFISILFLTSALTASSQRIYFIYFQTEPQRPFFIKMDEKLYSSTASGYLILPRLKDSTYHFTIGFPGNQIAEQRFSCSMGKKDHGYLVKNFSDKGWGLVDLQTQSVQMAGNDSKKDVSVVNTPVNAFTDLLAKAADDSTLKQKIVMAEEKKPEVIAKAPEPTDEKKESNLPATSASQNTIVAPANNSPALIKNEQKNDSAGTMAKTATGEGLQSAGKESAKRTNTLIDTTGKKVTVGKKDKTIKPVGDKTADANSNGDEKIQDRAVAKANNTLSDTANKNAISASEVKVSKPVEEKTDTGLAVQKQPTISNASNTETASVQPSFAKSKIARTSGTSTTAGFDMIFTDTYQDGTRDTIRILIPEEEKTASSNESQKNEVQKKPESSLSPGSSQQENVVKSISKNNCKQVASDADFYKLRKKMASGKSDASMIDEANKFFKTKCFTSSQIKNLSSLFLGDGGKYSFFDAAYMHISDTENFTSLESELKDEYFVNRFKAMLR